MTEQDYFNALHDLLEAKFIVAPTLAGSKFEIKEAGQDSMVVDPKGLSSCTAICLEKNKSAVWVTFKALHPYAHKKCDRIFVTWDAAKSQPVYLLCEMKSSQTAGAWTQLQVSLAFCRFLHELIRVNRSTCPQPRWGALTLHTLPASKQFNPLAFYAWPNAGERSDCPHMRVSRKSGELHLKRLLAGLP